MQKALALLVLITLSGSAFAEGKSSSISRGGLGFLFSDTNSFSNPGRFSLMRGRALQFLGTRNPEDSTQALTPSFVYGTGGFGLGVFVKREGLNMIVSDRSTDSVGAGLGFNFAKNRVSVGFGVEKSVDAFADDGVFLATITLHPAGKGFSMGAGVSTTTNVSPSTRTAHVAMGYAFNPMVSFEAIAKFNNLTDTNDITGSGFFTLSGQRAYLSAGANYVKLTKHVEAMGRVGVVFGAFDLSAIASKDFAFGKKLKYGGSLRVRF